MAMAKNWWKVAVNFLSGGDENIGPLSWNLTKGKLNLSPGIEVGDNSWGLSVDQDMTVIGSDGLQIEAAPENVSMGGTSFDKLTADIPPTPLVPFSILNPDNSKYLFILALGSEIISGLDEIDRDEYNTDIKYIYEVIDYDSFRPR